MFKLQIILKIPYGGKILKKILSVLAVSLLIAGCASASKEIKKEDFKIKKVHKFLKEASLKLEKQSFTESSGIDRFLNETDHKLAADKQGEEIIITWKYKNKTPIENVILKMVYKTEKEGDLKTIEKLYPSVTKGTYKFNLSNTGALFSKQGTLSLWKITLEYEGKVFAEKQSALWKDIQPWKEKAF